MGWLYKIVILIFTVYSVVTLISLQAQANRLRAAADEVERQNTIQRFSNASLQEDIDSDDHGELMARLARERLGLVMPGEIQIANSTP